MLSSSRQWILNKPIFPVPGKVQKNLSLQACPVLTQLQRINCFENCKPVSCLVNPAFCTTFKALRRAPSGLYTQTYWKNPYTWWTEMTLQGNRMRSQSLLWARCGARNLSREDMYHVTELGQEPRQPEKPGSMGKKSMLIRLELETRI